MKKTMLKLFALLLLGPLPLAANAVAVTGIFLVDDTWSLIHGSASPTGLAGEAVHFLRWGGTEADRTIALDLDLGTSMLTATGPQSYDLMSNNGDTATFTLNSLSLDLSGPNGFAGGTLDYVLVIDSGPYLPAMGDTYTGTFTFDENLFGGPFNTSTLSGAKLDVFGWGGDVTNDIGIDFGINAVVPIPGALLLLAPALLGLGFMRRR